MTPMRPPYLQELAELPNGIKVWVVEGSYVREALAEEFTNFGQHFRFPCIPENEFWIDNESDAGEHGFFITHLFIEHGLQARGIPYARALSIADALEAGARGAHGTIPGAPEFHKQHWKTLPGGIEVWIVLGHLVRDTHDIDFTAGGHNLVYKWIPKNEIWIDDALDDFERHFALVHEFHERCLMAAGQPYEDAHAAASALEHRCREAIAK